MNTPINESLKNILEQQHQQWLENPTTQTALRKMREHKERFVGLVSQQATNYTVTDSAIRHLTISIKNTDALLTLLTDTEIFTQNLKP